MYSIGMSILAGWYLFDKKNDEVMIVLLFMVIWELTMIRKIQERAEQKEEK